MKQHLHEELEQIRKSIALMGGRIEEAIQNAVTALIDRDTALAAEVIAGDHDVDLMEIDIEQRCLNILATQQPLASDLRFITAVLRINHDMERMADLASNIAREARRIASFDIFYMPLKLEEIIAEVRKMVRESLKALLAGDTELARSICREDDVVDEMDRETSGKLIEIMKSNPESVETATQLLMAVRHLERIADLATNIAEEVVFMVEGHTIKHHFKQEGDTEK
jgi:phosphate transport system protein